MLFAHDARITWQDFNDSMSPNLQDEREKTGQLMLYKNAWLHESGGLLGHAGSHPPDEDGLLDAAAFL